VFLLIHLIRSYVLGPKFTLLLALLFFPVRHTVTQDESLVELDLLVVALLLSSLSLLNIFLGTCDLLRPLVQEFGYVFLEVLRNGAYHLGCVTMHG
jgi:hypothetical protein